MRIFSLIWICLFLIMTGACSSSEEPAVEGSDGTQNQAVEERLKLVDLYRNCLQQAADDHERIEACDSYLKSAELLE
jgi:hypothetical protein